jgi:hypothetical protein
MRINFPKTALVVALWFFLVPLAFAADSPDQGEPSATELTGPAEPETSAELTNPAEPESPEDAPAPPDSQAQTEPEASAGDKAPEASAGGEAPEAPALSGAAEGGDLETLSPEAMELEMTVYYDERTGADYVEIRTPEKIEEYHYLSHIRYSDLIFILSDLLRRITREGYQWSSAPEISYEKNEEVALLYRRDLVKDLVYGIVQFPDFKVFLSALREPDGEHRFNAENGRDMMTLVFSFASCLAQAEQTLGIKQLEYTMRFFKQD